MRHLMSLKLVNIYESFATLVALVFWIMNLMPLHNMILKLGRILVGIATKIAYRCHEFFTVLFMIFKAIIKNK